MHRESLYEIFYRCDLDGNGFLSRKEFGLFQMKTSGEECDDDAWEVAKGITKNLFYHLWGYYAPLVQCDINSNSLLSSALKN